MARLFGQLHALIDGGVRGNAIEKAQWKAPRRRAIRTSGSSLRVGTLEQRANLLVQTNLPAKHAQHQRRGQIAVRGCERVDCFCCAADRQSGPGRARRRGEYGKRLCARERWQAWRSTQPRIRRERVSAQELGGVRRFLPSSCTSSNSSQVSPAQADEEPMVLDAHPSPAQRRPVAQRSSRAQPPCDARSAFCHRE